jgi:GNAT superfamily N-acetyltransferase
VTSVIEPFTAAHLDGAAALLAARHARHRAAEPLLAEADALAAVRHAFEGGSGAVAVRGGEVAGYLLGSVRERAAWGTHAWVDRAGHASADPEVARDLYAAAAPAWMAAGARLHLALVPAVPDLLDPWARLGFGQMQVHAIRPSGDPAPSGPPGLEIRPAVLADLDAIVEELADLIWRHQAGPPAFTGLEPPPAEELREGWAEALADPACAVFLATQDGRLAGHVLLHPAEAALGTPPGCVELGTQATVPDARGRGVGRALTAHALAWAAAAGYATIATDWRATNLLSSRYWPARGFRPTFHRLHRVVGIG